MKYNCHFCGKDVEENVLIDVDEEGIIIKSVPADVCRQCGEVYYSPTIAQMINDVVIYGKAGETSLSICQNLLNTDFRQWFKSYN